MTFWVPICPKSTSDTGHGQGWEPRTSGTGRAHGEARLYSCASHRHPTLGTHGRQDLLVYSIAIPVQMRHITVRG